MFAWFDGASPSLELCWHDQYDQIIRGPSGVLSELPGYAALMHNQQCQKLGVEACYVSDVHTTCICLDGHVGCGLSGTALCSLSDLGCTTLFDRLVLRVAGVTED